eukprot:TRINITY_DN4863_c0_g1_i4.p1 TRINITY_DN4863_c0_g1~~TRINITY_DN4863_c0_g1_i4.p1  ORF type:complete len:293 (+),score=29.53 TRINITY_DN4863_c0_g1_i4:121-879(+)
MNKTQSFLYVVFLCAVIFYFIAQEKITIEWCDPIALNQCATENQSKCECPVSEEPYSAPRVHASMPFRETFIYKPVYEERKGKCTAFGLHHQGVLRDFHSNYTRENGTREYIEYYSNKGLKYDPEESYPKVRIGYILPIHNEFDHFKRLWRAIYQPYHEYVLNVDLVVEGDLMERTIQFLQENNQTANVEVTSMRTPFSSNNEIARDMEMTWRLLKNNPNVDFVYYMSGADYPIRTEKYIQFFLVCGKDSLS